ncbi:glutamyl-tRNA synthetase [Sporothrix schenckii 1099-18]|uniref:glutamate--tRNA ligase n=1 Tax=Sporothrix schenckii 1099-18 TaxID=1397361 RepID=A0A0F2MNZ4_SPOSC|nr:glutamyl-tRNA synthetase [Sporothrix schenckii 1099-18]KJR89906.1 glutamyl-tRNA synthetase [Sporothrix schenckii 1099-18]
MNIFMPVGRSAYLRNGTQPHIVYLNRALRARSSTSSHFTPFSNRRPDRATHGQLPDRPARTRFAPSPTGYLHLGSLRTALYNYLLARATNGKFILRLEDTDQSRIVPDAEDRLYDDLRWAGLTWDEGQYARTGGVPTVAAHMALISSLNVFIFINNTSTDFYKRVKRFVASAHGTLGTYPGKCLPIPANESADRAARGEAHTVRFRSGPNPATVYDIVYGLYKKKLPEDHFIIMKSDGFPTYHFANVVDDHLMEITHVVRGAEWLISTAKHASLYDAFGWEAPKFAHVGLLVDSHRQKLSKRNMDIGIDSYRRDGVPPEALLNFSALLGWNPTKSPNKGVMSLDDMVKNFGLKFTKGDIVVNTEKLGFFHKKHIQMALSNPSLENDRIVDEYISDPVLQLVRETEAKRQRPSADGLQGQLTDRNSLSLLGEPIFQLLPYEGNLDDGHIRNRIRTAVRICRNEAVTIPSFFHAIRYLVWKPPAIYIKELLPGVLPDSASLFIDEAPSSTRGVMEYFIEQLGRIDDKNWFADTIQTTLGDITKRVTYREAEGTPVAAGYKFLRWGLLGLNKGPQISHLMEYLGRSETLSRVRLASTVTDSRLD